MEGEPESSQTQTASGRQRRSDHAVDDRSDSEPSVREKSKTGNGKVTKPSQIGVGPMPKSRKGRPKSVQIEVEEKVSKFMFSGNGPMPKSRKGRPKSVQNKEEEAGDDEVVTEVESVSKTKNGLEPRGRKGRPKSVRIKEEEDDNLAEVRKAEKTSQRSRNNNESDYSRKYKPRHRKPLDDEELHNGSSKVLKLIRFPSYEFFSNGFKFLVTIFSFMYIYCIQDL